MNKEIKERILKTVIEDIGPDITSRKFLSEDDLTALGYKFGDNVIVINAKLKKKPIDYTIIELKYEDDPKWVPSFCMLKVSTFKYPFTLNYPYNRYADIYNGK